jgi:spore photoproduct lyase
MNILDNYPFTVAQKNILNNIAKDFSMWNESNFEEQFPKELLEKYENKQLTKKIFEFYVDLHKSLQEKPNNYEGFEKVSYEVRKYSFEKIEKEGFGLGSCPVASEGTRCCNLLTLDAVESCGFDCSYCSIQSFL